MGSVAGGGMPVRAGGAAHRRLLPAAVRARGDARRGGDAARRRRAAVGDRLHRGVGGRRARAAPGGAGPTRDWRKENPSMAALIVAAVVLIFALVFASRAIRVIPQARAGVVERLGRYSRTLEPGLTLVTPFVDRVRPLVDLREQVVN